VKDLKDLDIIINTTEVDLAGYTPIADTAEMRDHILNEICTSKCPRCKMVNLLFSIYVDHLPFHVYIIPGIL